MHDRVLDRQQIEHLTVMLEITRNLNSTLDLPSLEKLIVESATELTACEDSSILLIDPKTGELRFESSAGLQEEKTQPIVVPLDSSIAGWIVKNNEPVIIADVSKDPRHLKLADEATGFHTRSLIGVPMSFKGRIIGVLQAVNKLEGEFTENDVERIAVLAAQAAVAVENARLMTELQVAYQDLSELDQLKSEFITTTSHELRTPLTAIKGYLQLITSGMVPSDRQGTMLDTVTHHVDTVIHLVNDLLLMQEMNAIELHMADTDLGEIVLSEMTEVRALSESAGITWRPEIEAGLPMVWGDGEHLQRMLHCLFDNAIKYSPDGGEVTVRAFARDENVVVEICDPGVGIPPEEHERIFDRFYRIERVGDHLFGGLGLGLAIARQIAQQHGGAISVESALGEGSTFAVELPAKPT